MEAGAKSGALITANYGRQYKREVLAVPDNIYRQESMGSNKLIGDGASIYLNKEQLLIDNRYESKREASYDMPMNDNVLDNLDETEKELSKYYHLKEKNIRRTEHCHWNGYDEVIRKIIPDGARG